MSVISPSVPTHGEQGSTRLLLTSVEVAWLLGVSRSRVYELMNAGALRSVAIGRSRRIPRQAVDEFINSLTNGNDAA